mmetsp:Transcript_30561/g.94412  ORF Transcript_30561/g.94412 Transcript_30561/m.94412 type:complete len:245 (-) Transcript_30561:1639-2373(-)
MCFDSTSRSVARSRAASFARGDDGWCGAAALLRAAKRSLAAAMTSALAVPSSSSAASASPLARAFAMRSARASRESMSAVRYAAPTSGTTRVAASIALGGTKPNWMRKSRPVFSRWPRSTVIGLPAVMCFVATTVMTCDSSLYSTLALGSSSCVSRSTMGASTSSPVRFSRRVSTCERASKYDWRVKPRGSIVFTSSSVANSTSHSAFMRSISLRTCGSKSKSATSSSVKNGGSLFADLVKVLK